VYVNSFTLSQKEMLASAVRVTGSRESEWTITREGTRERYVTGVKEMQEGKRIGFANMMYTRVFFDDGCGDFETGRGTLNELLGLPKEDVYEATMVAVERSKVQTWG
jgi:hypothetical protein